MELEERVFDDIVSDIAARDSVEVEKAIPEQKKTFCFEVVFYYTERSVEKKLRTIERRFDLLGIPYEERWRNVDMNNEKHLNMKFWFPSKRISFGTVMQLYHLCIYVDRHLNALTKIDEQSLDFGHLCDFHYFFQRDTIFKKLCHFDDETLKRSFCRYYNDDVLYKNYIARTQENLIRNYFGKKYDTYSFRTISEMSGFANGRIFKDDFWKICHSKYDTLKAYKLIVTYTGLEEYSQLRSYYKCDNLTPLNSLNAYKLHNRPILSSTVYELRLEWRYIFLFFIGFTERTDFEWLVVDVSSNKYSRVVNLIQTLFGKRTKMLCKKILKEMFYSYKREYNERNRFAE